MRRRDFWSTQKLTAPSFRIIGAGLTVRRPHVIEALQGREEKSPIVDYVVEDYIGNVLATFLIQGDAILIQGDAI